MYNGEAEATPVAMARHNARLTKGTLVVCPEHGHSTILMEAEAVILALVKGEVVASSAKTGVEWKVTKEG